MKACDVMTPNVVTVGPDLDVAAVANTLCSNGISAVPVVDMGGRLVGIVSEGDLMRRAETGTDRRRAWWLELLTDTRALAEEFVQAHARKAGDVMTRDVVTVSPDTPLAEIAALFETHGIKRVPVVAAGRLLGIVSRANLIRALASRGRDFPPAQPDDDSLRRLILGQLQDKPWCRRPVSVTVDHGVVDLSGYVDSAAEKDAIRVAAEAIPGVKSVNDRLRLYPALHGI